MPIESVVLSFDSIKIYLVMNLSIEPISKVIDPLSICK